MLFITSYVISYRLNRPYKGDNEHQPIKDLMNIIIQ